MLDQAGKAFPGMNALAYLAFLSAMKTFYALTMPSLIFVSIGRAYSSGELFNDSPLGHPPGLSPQCLTRLEKLFQGQML